MTRLLLLRVPRRRRLGPSRPLYADEKFLGLTLGWRVKAILVIAAALIVTVVWLVLSMYAAINVAHRQRVADARVSNAQIAENARLIQEVQQAIRGEQRSTRDLACYVVHYADSAPERRASGRRFVDSLSARYGCAGYTPGRPPNYSTAPGSAPPPPSASTPAPTPRPAPPATPSRTPTPTAGTAPPVVPAPRPPTTTPTRTTVTPPPASTPAPAPSSITAGLCAVTPAVCHALGL